VLAAREGEEMGADEWLAANSDVDVPGHPRPPLVPGPNPACEKAVEWIKKNTAFPADSAGAKDLQRILDEELGRGKGLTTVVGDDDTRTLRQEPGFTYEMGPQTVKSGKPTILAARGGEFFVFELSPQKAKNWDLTPNGLRFRPLRDRSALKRNSPLVELSTPSIDKAVNVDGTEKLTGSIPYRGLEEARGNFSLRMTYSTEERSPASFHHLKSNIRQERGSFQFTFLPVNHDDAHSGPLVVLFELVLFDDSARRGDPMVVSNCVATVINVAK
jgi:hypothetical protein